MLEENKEENKMMTGGELTSFQKRFGKEFINEKAVIAKFGKIVKKICPGNAFNSPNSKKAGNIVCDYSTEYYETAKISCKKCNKLLMTEAEFAKYDEAVKKANDPDRKR